MKNKAIYTTKEAANYLGVSTSTIWKNADYSPLPGLQGDKDGLVIFQNGLHERRITL